MGIERDNLITAGIAEMRISDDPAKTIITYSLGSCVAVVIHDPVAKVGGILHAMLPETLDDRSDPTFNPCKYIDTGVPLLFLEAYTLGAKKNRIEVSVAGGAQIMDDSGYFNIGKRNLASLRKVFWRNGILIGKEHVEGAISRTVSLDVGTGRVMVRLGWNEVIVL